MKLKIEDLTVESFAPFGEVINQPARGHDAQGPGWTWWCFPREQRPGGWHQFG